MKKLSHEQIAKIIKDNWQHKTFKEIGKLVNLSDVAVGSRGKRMGLPAKPRGGTNKTEKVASLKDDLFAHLLKTKAHHTFEELSDKFDIGISKIKNAVDELKKENKNFEFRDSGLSINNSIDRSKPTVIDSSHLIGKRIKFGFVTDNHLGSKYERLDALNALYQRFESVGITTVYNAGNCIDGEARFNKFDIHKYGMQAQSEYFAEVYPKLKGGKTFFITGDDHEGWYVQREGVNIGKFMENCAIQAGRKDLVYLGHMEHDVVIKSKKGQAIIRIVHPGGGSSYAYSYTSQKIVESYSPGEKPNIVLGGHYHKMNYSFIRGVHFIQGGCTMDQSPFMRKKRLEAHVGGWIIEIQQGANGTIQSLQAEWIPFYGKEVYDKDLLWKYQY